MTPSAGTIDTFVILGGHGDLTGRYLLPALVRLEAAGLLPPQTQVLAVDRAADDDDTYRRSARERIEQHLPGVDAEALLRRLRYRQGDVTSAAELRTALSTARGSRAVYLALPPAVAGRTLEALAGLGLPKGTRLVVEKPFGEDLEGARRLNSLIRKCFDEDDVFRVDHFLAKQSVLDILGLRFANRMFEPSWNGLHIHRVDIVWDEVLALEGRASYYDHAGALRDMVQNHLLQLLALVAMEPPTSLDQRDLRDGKVEALRAVHPPGPDEMATATRRAVYTRGRLGERDVPSYVDEDGVDASRGTETYAEVILRVQNWRWSGVPFRLRTGKALGRGRQEIALHFKPAPHPPFQGKPAPDVLRFSLGPDAISLDVNLNGAGDPFDLERATLSAGFADQQLPPYSLLIREIMSGDPTLSIRDDEAEEGWRIVEPILAAWQDGVVPLEQYPAGSDGPPGSAQLA